MLKIKDASGEVVGVLKDEDNAPVMNQKEKLQELAELSEEVDGYEELNQNNNEGEE